MMALLYKVWCPTPASLFLPSSLVPLHMLVALRLPSPSGTTPNPSSPPPWQPGRDQAWQRQVQRFFVYFKREGVFIHGEWCRDVQRGEITHSFPHALRAMWEGQEGGTGSRRRKKPAIRIIKWIINEKRIQVHRNNFVKRRKYGYWKPRRKTGTDSSPTSLKELSSTLV